MSYRNIAGYTLMCLMSAHFVVIVLVNCGVKFSQTFQLAWMSGVLVPAVFTNLALFLAIVFEDPAKWHG